jgi:putative ABC transport system ATP-binding protein
MHLHQQLVEDKDSKIHLHQKCQAEEVEEETEEVINMRDIISVRNLTKIYKMGEVEVRALNGISLDIHEGEFVAVMGTSGSGKSTFMNIIGCLDKPTSGDYFLDGKNIEKMDRDELAKLRNTKIGFVFQSFNLLSRTTAIENVELPLLYNSSISAKERRERAVHALEAVGLGKRSDHFPNQLSGGQQQRVAIARALVNDSVVIMADEPTGNLDSKTSVEVMEIFQGLNEKGITIVLVTHEPDIAEFTTRNVFFKDGNIIKDEKVEHRKNAKEVLKELNKSTTEEAKE